MHRRIAPLALASLFVLATACASSGSGSASGSAACDLQPKDSVFAAHGPVYRDCAVTTKAKLITTGLHPDYTPPSGTRCFTAEYEFVVKPDGVVDVASARLVKTNDDRFADALRSMLPRLKFQPATRDGVPVAQITTLKDGGQVQTMVVVVPAGSPPPTRPSPGRPGPGC